MAPERAGGAVGTLLLMTAAGHLAVGTALLRAPLKAIARDGLAGAVGPVERQPERHAALWFMLGGVQLALLGRLAGAILAAGGRLPASLGWGLLGMGGMGRRCSPARAASGCCCRRGCWHSWPRRPQGVSGERRRARGRRARGPRCG